MIMLRNSTYLTVLCSGLQSYHNKRQGRTLYILYICAVATAAECEVLNEYDIWSS